MRHTFLKLVCLIFCYFNVSAVFAISYPLPAPNTSLVGQKQYALTHYGESVIQMAEQHDVGFNALKNANPHLNLNRRFLADEIVQIPTQHLLPDTSQKGIIINLPEMRLYYFAPDTHQLFTFPIGIGKIGNTIPLVKTVVTRKTEHPFWIPPKSIRDYNLNEFGIELPTVMPAGPDNPLGPYAIYMRLPTYLIHSTIYPESVGKRASFGCIRMFESDIKELYPLMKKGIPVFIIDMPLKFGWQEDRLYMEKYPSLSERKQNNATHLSQVIHQIVLKTQHQATLVDWQGVSYIAAENDGMPHEIGKLIPTKQNAQNWQFIK
ncbi:MAG: hypothetical protein A3E85_05940 [Gammaproteobacteria bacterium RIFCSPHIGHO2_12_FULL_45_12]|nr:MAG: hypothetical protein A3E85_05940 [Gammaproteobacteria bacterium RIFCSPHIGHO2_12_FULL_45_12]